MLGFIKKELLMIKGNFKSIWLILIIYLLIGIFNKMDVSFILPFICTVIMISTFSYDNLNSWDAYAFTLPNGRKNLVKSKYLVTILTILFFSILSIPLSILITHLNNLPVNYLEILVTLFGAIFGTLFIISIMYPIIYKLGIEKARITIFVIIFGIAIVGAILIQFVNFEFIPNIISTLSNYLIPILIIILILSVLISYFISLKIVSKKEY